MLRFSILIFAIIVYGSLYPFEFRDAGGVVDAVHHLAQAWPERSSFPDVLANLLLYAPFGFAVAAHSGRRWGLAVASICGTALAAALSVTMELLQHFLPARSVSLFDVVCNVLGALAGTIAGWVTTHRRSGRSWELPQVADQMALLLAAAWIADRLWPFVPTLDVSHVKEALKPLLLHPQLSVIDVFRHGASWMAFAALMRSAFLDRRWRSPVYAIMVAGPFAGLVIVGREVTASAVLGAALAVAGSLGLRQLSEKATARIIAPLMVATVALVGLAPYAFVASPRRFDWVPFRGFIDGTMLAATGAFLTKIFLFGTAIWMLARAGLGALVAGGVAATVLLAIGFAQTYLPGRSAGVTDAMIAIGLATALCWLRVPALAEPIGMTAPGGSRRPGMAEGESGVGGAAQ